MAQVRPESRNILKIPVADPLAGYTARKDMIDTAVMGVLAGGRYILGEEVSAFEAEFAAYTGAGHCVGVGSGTDALRLSLAALGAGPGDEVITPSHTAVATVAAIAETGATPVFADIAPATYTLDPAEVERAVTGRTKAVAAVSLYGHPADLDALADICSRRGLALVEDCAQAHGAMWRGRRVGSWGTVGCFSFYPTKNLGAFGDGGAIVTNSVELAEKIRLLREYGWKQRYVSHIHGWNSRLDELQAAILRVKLRGLDEDNEARRAWAAVYNESLKDTPLQLPGEARDSRHVYHLYVAATGERERLIAHLKKEGVGAAIHYPVPVHKQPAYANANATLPVTERAAERVVSLPMFPELGKDRALAVAEAIRRFFR
ncbi:MAG: DegT/DnrJ/EryC1/StrS family aminotransferase [Candidatus Nitrospinota bacterium M3_3B_026]